MDFGSVLHKAQRNEKDGKSQGVRYYSTKFEPPKKEKREKAQLSENIKKFLARKEVEEQKKRREEQKKLEGLLALRAQDKKATRRVNVMLKRTKSANQSVIQDAVDNNNTAVTLAGPDAQCDEDDYGYVSQESAAFYNKMMEKYNKLPDEPKFSLDKKKRVSTNLASTKQRVIANLERAKEEANMPHKRKRKHKEECSSGTYEDDLPESQPVVAKKTKLPPPTLNFNDLLKLAEKKQFEPIIIEPKVKEDEKLLTKKQKKEFEREREWRDRKDGKLPPLDKPNNNKIPKLNEKSKDFKIPTTVKKVAAVATTVSGGHDKKLNSSQSLANNNINNNKKPIVSSSYNNNRVSGLGDRKPNNRENVPLNQSSGSKPVSNGSRPGTSSNSLMKSKSDQIDRRKEIDSYRNQSKCRELPPKRNAQSDLKPRQFSPSDVRPKQFPPSDIRPKQFPPRDLKPKQLPMSDVRRREFPSKDVRRKPLAVNKGRILDDDDEDEYDSEMDDFIDDGPEDGDDISKHISEIFGYDKSKYRNVDDDIDNMESTFAQQMREEVISTKIGIMEDLEDMKLEEEEKRRKASIKKKIAKK